MNIFEKDGKRYRIEPGKVYGPGGIDKDYLENLILTFPAGPIYPSWGEFLAEKVKDKGFEVVETDPPESVEGRVY
jgi:hypothetical protein